MIFELKDLRLLSGWNYITVRLRFWQLVCATEKCCQNSIMREKKLFLLFNNLLKYD